MVLGLRIWSVAACLLMLAFAGCGGSDDEEITKAEFIDRADAICKENTEERSAAATAFIEEHKGEPPKSAAEEVVLEVALPAVQEELDGLSDLPKPAGEEERIEAILVALERGIERVEADPEKATQRSLGWFREFETLAIEYGFDECGNI